MNALTSKMEIGGPMASLYLLGNPDHYASHKFVTVYWKNYVREVFKSWKLEEDLQEIIPEKLVVQKGVEGEIVGFSTVDDYIYRPKIFECKTLYEWVQMSTRCKKPKSKKKKNSSSEDEYKIIEVEEKPQPKFKFKAKKYSDYSEAETDDLNLTTEHELSDDNVDISEYEPSESGSDRSFDSEIEERYSGKATTMYAFLKDHPLCKTHKVKFDKQKKNTVPNFVGGSLPRCDQGDREYYCATMLTLFKPWRSGKCLKKEDQSFDEAFNSFNFTTQQTQYMRNFNLRYECNDARDDFSAQLKKGNSSGGVFNQWMSSEDIADLDGYEFHDGANFEQENDDECKAEKYTTVGRLAQLKQNEMTATRMALEDVGWTDKSPNGLEQIDKTPVLPEHMHNGFKWKALIEEKRQEVLAERNKHIPSKSNLRTKADPNENDVRIIDRSYLQKSFKAKSAAAQKIIDEAVQEFSLNTEQERAFRIVANHSVEPKSEQLKMYLGGMGGTGKSQVIKALSVFLEKRNEAHRFVILGPTGTSAALLNGSTYHSFLGLGFGNNKKNEAVNIAQVKMKLEGVNYIFIDEVSMLSCHDMYKISAQLAKVLNAFDLPFGGMNIIFAGDFAQLPPVGGSSLYSESIGTQVHSGLRPGGQEATVGKALWHQITTVVVLRKNMRQKTQSSADALLRKALINMRYAKCTPEDISFLRTLQAGQRPDQPKISAKEFRNVAIICGRHTQKDQINSMGCERFAEDTGQELTDFYSIDKRGKDIDPASGDKKKKKTTSEKYSTNELQFVDQHEIWKLRHGSTENVAGKLSLCIGMPVMIRNNDATELCITKGQEGFVAGWQFQIGPYGKRILDTLFVKLDKPSKNIKIPGLPENVVPIVKTSKTIQCTYLNDSSDSIERQQVPILPNFAMTDYGGQGKSRLKNPVHLSSCHSHMSYYTCLSRSTSAAGTIIIQGFDPSVITRGCSGYLRQEFCEHEILDDITRLRYEGNLPDNINGSLRNSLITQYQEWKGTDYVPNNMDEALKWSKNDPMNLLPIITDSAWEIIDKSKKPKIVSKPVTNFVPAKGSIPVIKPQNEFNESEHVNKKIKVDNEYTSSTINSPAGLRWDSNNYSCSYDSLFSILYNTFIENHVDWTIYYQNINEEYMKVLGNGFEEAYQENISLEVIRDVVRDKLYQSYPTLFPKGQNGASVSELAFKVLASNTLDGISNLYCSTCDQYEPDIEYNIGCVFNITPYKVPSTQYFISELKIPQNERCNECLTKLKIFLTYNEPPKLLILEYPYTTIKTSHKIKIKVNNTNTLLYLKGIIYYGENHFTSRIISKDGKIWFNDGITTGGRSIEEGHLSMMSDKNLRKCKGKDLILAVYACNL